MPCFPTCLKTVALAALVAAATAAQEPVAPAAGEETAPAAPGTPGAEHERLGHLVGSWRFTLRIWNAPDAEPTVMQGTAEGRWILDRRFVHTIYRGELFGQPFEGWAIEGYDDRSNQYVRTWRDNLGTYTTVYRGTWDEASGERTLSTQFTDPVSGQSFETRAVITATTDDAYTYATQIVLAADSIFTTMELAAERAPTAGEGQ